MKTLILLASFLVANSVFAQTQKPAEVPMALQTQFSCHMTLNDNIKNQKLDDQTQDYTLGQGHGWPPRFELGVGQPLGYEVIISDNSNRLFISALPGQISQPDGHILFASLSGGGSARAIANLPLAKTLHLDLTVSAKTLNVDCSPKE